uniref:Uncharacterized protein n=1 Tax=Rhizophora mucronata TaxID=61149 RepID=A0A2P2NB63_RHIMU
MQTSRNPSILSSHLQSMWCHVSSKNFLNVSLQKFLKFISRLHKLFNQCKNSNLLMFCSRA